MDKKQIVLVGILLCSLFFIPSVFAQATGCCMDPNADSSVVCKDVTSSACGSPVSSNSCSNEPLCQPPGGTCVKCQQIGSTITTLRWGLPLTACQQGEQSVGTDPSPQSSCSGPSVPSPQTVVNIGGTVFEIINNVNTPVSGAFVQCNGAFNTTSSNGAYQLNGCTRQAVVQITASKGVKSGTQNVSVPSGVSDIGSIAVTLSSSTTATLTIVVKNQTGAFISNAVVNLTSGNYKSGKVTAATGTVSFNDVPVGNVNLEINALPYSQYTNVTSTSVGTFTATLTKQPTVSISGFIFDGTSSTTPQGKVSGATIKLFQNSLQKASTFSDSSGRYTFPAVTVGNDYSIQAEASGFSTNSYVGINLIQNQIYTNEFNITLSSGTGASATPPSATTQVTFKVRSATANIDGAYISPPTTIPVTDSSGETIALFVPRAQPYSVVIFKDGFLKNISTFVVGSTPITVDVMLRPARTIIVDGTAVNKSTIPKVYVSNPQVTLLDKTATGNANGFFSITTTVDETLTQVPIHISAPGHFPEFRTINIVPSQTAPYHLGDVLLQPSTCTNENQITLNINGTLVQDNINLLWSGDCTPLSYAVRKTTTGAEPYQTLATLQNTVHTYSDQIVQPGNYCYVINATYELLGQGIVTKQTAQFCQPITSTQCLTSSESFCSGNQVVSCVGGQEQQTPCDSGMICLQGNNGAYCETEQECTKCNRPFGLFSSQISYGALFGGKLFTPYILDIQDLATEDIAQQNCDESNTCYLETSKTVVDKFNSCSGINSCYDYLSQSSCEGDFLGNNKCLPAEDCQWVESQYGDLGVGVCRPSDPTKQNCNEYATRSTNTNKVFGEGLQEVCELYGDANQGVSCYFNQQQGACLNQNQVSCYDYGTNKNDCIAFDGDEVNATVNVLWQAALGNGVKPYLKSSGTNLIGNRSHDRFDLGICKFVAGSCVRDADDNQNKYPLSTTVNGVQKYYSLLNNGRDCNAGDIDCIAQDITPPETTISVRDGAFVNKLEFDVVVAENGSKKAPKTYFNATQGTTSNYPKSELTNGKIIQSVSGNPENQPWTISYFSEDYQHNLEPLRSLSVILDKKAPEIEFTYDLVPHFGKGTVDFIPTLSLPQLRSSDGTPNDEFAYCIQTENDGLFDDTNGHITANFDDRNGNHPSLSPMGNVLRSSWKETYSNVRTGKDGISVTYSWTCFDQAGNPSTSNSAQLELDPDIVISQPTRLTVSNRSNVPISVLTYFPGECRYVLATSQPSLAQYSTWSVFNAGTHSNNKQNHSATVNLPTGTYHRFYVACNLTNVLGENQEIVDGSDLDDVLITVDDVAPQTKAFINNKEVLSWPTWVNGFDKTIELRCQDVVMSNLPFRPESGCGNVYYCTEEGCNVGDKVVVPSITHSSSLSFFSSDILGNNETVQQRSVLFDNLKPELNLSAPFNDTTYVETKDRQIVLKGFIVNVGPEGLPVNASPIVNVSYEIEQRPGRQPILITSTANARGEIPIEVQVPLELHKENTLKVTIQDAAGNSRELEYTIVQDAQGPALVDNQISGQGVSDFGASVYPFIESGKDFNIVVSDVRDSFPSTALTSQDLRNRVDSVWIEDWTKSKYMMIENSDGSWSTTLKTSLWPISSVNLRTTVTIFARDILGNVNQKEIVLEVKDNQLPDATLRFENLYGDQITTLKKGRSAVIVSSSEPLENVTLALTMQDGSSTQNIIFTKRDLSAVTWRGIFMLPEGLRGIAIVNGVMYDQNGNPSSAFTPTEVNTDTFNVTAPQPLIGTLVNGVWYVNQQSLEYTNLAAENQFIVNGKLVTIANNRVPLEIGLNNIVVRIEDQEHNYDIFNQQVFVDITSPRIVSSNSKTYADASQFRVDFVEQGGSGLDIAGTTLIVAGLTKRPDSATATSLGLSSGELSGPSTYSAQVTIRDLSGNSITEIISFRINANAPSVPISSPDLTLKDGIYFTNKDSVDLTLPATPLFLPGSTTQITSPLNVPLQEGSNTVSLVDADGNFWNYEIVKDSAVPGLSAINLADVTNANPLSFTVPVFGEDFPLSSIVAIIDGGQPQELVYLDNGQYAFKNNLDLPAGEHTVEIIAKDVLGQESTIQKTFTVDKTLADFNIGDIILDNSAGVVGGIRRFGSEIVSNQHQVIFTIPYSNEDIQTAYVIGEDGKAYVGSLTPSTTRIESIKLVGQTFEETLNGLNIVVQDSAGNTLTKPISILKDLQPPTLVRLDVTRFGQST